MNVMTATGYSSRDTAALARVTYRQLDWWEYRGLVRPSITAGRGSGSRRRYSDRDLLTAKVLGLLCGATGGTSFTPDLWDVRAAVDAADGITDPVLVLDGTRTLVVEASPRTFDVPGRFGRCVRLLPLDALRAELASDVAEHARNAAERKTRANQRTVE